jgi:hypothetical protein
VKLSGFVKYSQRALAARRRAPVHRRAGRRVPRSTTACGHRTGRTLRAPARVDYGVQLGVAQRLFPGPTRCAVRSCSTNAKRLFWL